MNTISPQQLINRGFNLLSVSIAGLAGFAFLPEAFLEKDLPDKIDDILLFLLALVAIYWYSRSNNRYVRSAVPVVLICLGLAIKLVGIIIEYADPEAVGDDFGGLILFILATGLVIYQYSKSKTLSGSVNK
jgi:peptidoglycan/LPS O-acetylase OafA/YrhL